MVLKVATNKRANFHPYVFVWPDEDIQDAIARHRRVTGHTGACIVTLVSE